jgi:threonine dehydrogenase-like Zn-dependent dehydrogenase
MKAAVVEKPGTLVVREVPEPVLGEYDALVDVLYGATCTGTDSHLVKGSFPFPIDYPAVLGHESVGRVVKLGKKVRNFRSGDTVTRVGMLPPADGSVGVCWGGFAERGIARDHWAMKADGRPESEWSGFRVNQVIPPGVDPRIAPMFTTWRETLSYLSRIRLPAGARVLVIGSGGNGLAFARHAVLLGAGQVWMVGSPRLRSAALGLGLAGLVDYAAADALAQLQSAAPSGFDLVIDAVGKAGQADRFLPAVAAGGTIGIYGLDDFASVSVSPRLARGSFTVWNGGYDEAETHQRVSELALQGRLAADAWYDPAKTWPLASIADAFQALWKKQGVKALIAMGT